MKGDINWYFVTEPGLKPKTLEKDKALNREAVRATSAKAAAWIFHIKLIGLGQALVDPNETAFYWVYNSKGEHEDTIEIPEILDEVFCKNLKDAFHCEVYVERNPVGYGETDFDAVKAHMAAMQGGIASLGNTASNPSVTSTSATGNRFFAWDDPDTEGTTVAFGSLAEIQNDKLQGDGASSQQLVAEDLEDDGSLCEDYLVCSPKSVADCRAICLAAGLVEDPNLQSTGWA